MAKNEVKVTLKVDDNGNLKKTGTKAKKAAKDLDKLGRSTKNADRNMKGLSQQSSNSSKNFSKMAQGMNGGLVPAYATLAAQIFAVTALFRFLQEAANYRVLIEGQKQFAAETGIAYNSITKALQNATDGQLAFKDAAQAAAIGSAAGVNPDQLERLAKVAKNASIALGRDLTDSFNRLIRGTTKAEPELLDELGIILRLDTATENYAAQINKTKEQLTIFEKSQAVTNEVLRQGEGKFGAIGDTVPVNALNQFGKAFDDVINKIYEFIGPMAEGLARFFSKNLYAFMGALTIFAVPIIKLILPSMDAWSAKTVKAAKVHKDKYTDMKADLASYQAIHAKAAAGAGINKQTFQMHAKKAGLSDTSGRGKAAAIKHYEMETTKIVADQNYKRTGILKNATTQQVAILKDSYTKMMADTKGTTTWVSRQWQTMGLKFKVVTTGMQAAWAGTMAFMKSAAAKAGKFINRAFSWLMAISVLVMLWDVIKPYLGIVEKEDPLEDTLSTVKSLNKELGNMSKRFNEKIGSTTGNTLKDGLDNLTFQGNMAQSANLSARIDQYAGSSDEDKARLLPGLQQTMKELGEVNPEFANLNRTINTTSGISKSAGEAIKNLARNMQSGKAAAQQLANAMSELSKAKNNYITGKAKLPFMALLTPLMLGKEGAEQSKAALQRELKGVEGVEKSLNSEISIGTSLFNSPNQLSNQINQKNMPARYERWILDQADRRKNFVRKKQLNNEIGEVDKQGTAMGIEGQEYLEFSTRAGAATKGKMDSQIDSAAITRTDSLAKSRKALNKINQKGFDIAVQEESILIAKKLREEDSVQKDPLKLAMANLMVQSEEDKLRLLEAQKKAMEDLEDPLTMIKDASIAAFDTGLQSAIMGVIDGTKSMKEGFLDMAKAVLVAIAQIIAQMIAMKALQAIGLTIPMASGGMIGGSKPKGYRSGGVVTEPTYLVGEGKYNEAVVPLPDGRSIPVMMKGGSGGNANVTVNIAADGSTTESMTSDGGAQGAQLGRAISAAVQEEMHKQQRPGGILSPYGG